MNIECFDMNNMTRNDKGSKAMMPSTRKANAKASKRRLASGVHPLAH